MAIYIWPYTWLQKGSTKGKGLGMDGFPDRQARPHPSPLYTLD